MSLLCLGLSHTHTPVEVRERVAVPGKDLSEAVQSLTALEDVEEAVIVSTCNRMEIYAASQSPGAAAAQVDAWLRRRFHLESGVELFQYRREAAARHLFSVASGLDSMVLGETEIFGQLKDAYAAAHAAGTTARMLNKLFQESFRVGKAVRNGTEIQRGSTSVGSVAVELAEKIFGDLRDSHVMLLGAGDMSRRCAQSLQSRGAKGIIVSNRSRDRAVELATEMGGQAIAFEDWPARTAGVDVIISSTAAPHTVIHPEQILPAMRRRRGRPLFIIDIAVPRDVDPRVHAIEGVYLYDIDALETQAAETRQRRAREIERCLAIIEEHVKSSPLFAPAPPPGAPSPRSLTHT
ncbi:MAG: glutamyl-tRNA reductase [Verrucomicrobiaceae bacterium]|nr:MAG: glutamyl-tRNA reductase [Verrucomicrobiaceae bacterium]